MEEVRERHQKAAEGLPSIAPRTVAAPKQPSAEERAMHDLLHMTPAAWCESCILGNQLGNAHRMSTYEKKHSGATSVVLDYAYLATNGEWKSRDEPEPPASEIFATTLVMINTDTLMFRAVSMPTKAISEFAMC